MNSGQRKSALSYIPGLKNNAVLQLILVSGVAFVMLGICWAIIKILYDGNESLFNHYFIANIGLPTLAGLKYHWWTLLTYGWFHFNGFWELFSNMVWLYCFGSVVQMLIGYKQVIPLYAYSLIAGGIFYLAAQLIPGAMGQTPLIVGLLGSRAGLMGLAAAAFTLTPRYRFYLTEYFSIPMPVVAGIFTVLMLMGSGFYMPIMLLLAGGALCGFCYVRILQAGYRPGDWIYRFSENMEQMVTPGGNGRGNSQHRQRKEILHKLYETHHGTSQNRIDDILDKINQKGYNSLSSEEKEILIRAGKE